MIEDQPRMRIKHGFTPSRSPFADPDVCVVLLARRTCPYRRDEHDPNIPLEDVDAFGRRRKPSVWPQDQTDDDHETCVECRARLPLDLPDDWGLL